MKLRIGTRASALAVVQTEWVRDRLLEAQPELEIDIVKMKTTGDRILDRPLAAIGGKGLFVREIERALLQKDIDIAVHSLKDMPVDQPEGLELACFPKRESPFDMLCNRGDEPLKLRDLPDGARVGTGSARRGRQLLLVRPDLEIVGLRGNIQTRLRKRQEENLDAVILAESGLNRAGITEPGFAQLSPDDCIPAPGQGTLALEIRTDDSATRELVAHLDHWETRLATSAERACLEAIGGDCHTPFAAWAEIRDAGVTLSCRLFGDTHFAEEERYAEWTTDPDDKDARDLGLELGKLLRADVDNPPGHNR